MNIWKQKALQEKANTPTKSPQIVPPLVAEKTEDELDQMSKIVQQHKSFTGTFDENKSSPPLPQE